MNNSISYKYFYLLFFYIACFKFLIIPIDEPDFFIRFNEVDFLISLFGNSELLFLDYDNILKLCNISYGDISLLKDIDYSKCHESFDIKILKIIIQFLILFLIITFYKLKKDICFLKFKTILCVSLFPSFIYFSGLLSLESIFFIITFIYFLSKNYIFKSILLIILYLIDIGNFIVFIFFIFNHILVKNLGVKKYIFLSIVFLLVLCNAIFYIEGYFPRLDSILQNQSNLIVNYDYPYNFLITLSSLIFLTPYGFYSPITILPLIYYSFIYFFELRKNNFKYTNNSHLISFIYTLIFFISLFPNYAYAKYYIFILPYLFIHLIKVLGFSRSLNLSSFTSLSVLIFISLFYI